MEDYFGFLFGKFFIGGILLAMKIYLYFDTKSKLDKEYIFNDEYYLYLQSIKKIIRYLLLLIPLSDVNTIFILSKRIKRIKWNCFIRKKYKFVEIK